MLKLLTKKDRHTVYCPYDPAFDFGALDADAIGAVIRSYMESLDVQIIEPYRKGEATPFVVCGLTGWERSKANDIKDFTDRSYEILRLGLVSSPLFPTMPATLDALHELPAVVAQFLAVAIVNVGSLDPQTKKASTSLPMAGGESGLTATAVPATTT